MGLVVVITGTCYRAVKCHRVHKWPVGIVTSHRRHKKEIPEDVMVMIMLDQSHNQKIWFCLKFNWERIGGEFTATEFVLTTSIYCVGGEGGGVQSTSQCCAQGTIIINLYYTVRGGGGCGGYDVQSMDEQKLSRWIPSHLSCLVPYATVGILLSNLWRLQCWTQTHARIRTRPPTLPSTSLLSAKSHLLIVLAYELPTNGSQFMEIHINMVISTGWRNSLS